MKFGKAIRRRAYQPWVENYVDYKRLKKIIKKISKLKNALKHQQQQEQEQQQPQQQPQSPPLSAQEPLLLSTETVAAPVATTSTTAAAAVPVVQFQNLSNEFLMSLAQEADKVDRFYLEQLRQIRQDLLPMTDTINESKTNIEQANIDRKAFSTQCTELDRLRSFVILNYLAFTKILKKFDKKCDQSIKHTVLDCIQLRPFYSSTELASLLTQAECAAAILAGNPSAFKEDYVCSVCIQVLSNPVVLSCAHRFCWHCLAKASLFGQCCPVCRKQQSLDPEHYQVDHTLHSFLVQHFPQDVPAEIFPNATATSSEDMEVHEHDDNTNKSVHADMITEQEVEQEQEQEIDTDDDHDGHNMKKSQVSNTIVVDDECEVIKGTQNTPDTLKTISYLLKCVKAGSFVVLDIDETIVMSPRHAVLLSPQGIQSFQDEINTSSMEYCKKVALCQKMQSILDDKVLVESNTAQVIQHLQNQGCWVFGLTSRYANLASRTHTTLQRVGVDMNKNALLPPHQALQDPDTEALYSNGVIYTNARDKGDVLNRFLTNVIFREWLSTGQCKRSPPAGLFFLDDRLDNCESIQHNLPVCQKLSIPIRSFHYVACTSLTNPPDYSKLLNIQIKQFLQHQQVWDDHTTRKMGCC